MALVKPRFDPNSITAKMCRALLAGGIPLKQIETREAVWETAFQNYEKFQKVIEGLTHQGVPWAMDDLDPLTRHDLYLRESGREAIALLKKNLGSQNLKPGTRDYEERLAVGLFYFACAPSPLTMHSFRDEVEKKFPGMGELKSLGLSDFYKFILDNGGWGLTFMDYKGGVEQELSALEAFRKGIGACTEVSKLLFALFRMAGLKPQFVVMRAQPLLKVLTSLMKQKSGNLEGWGHAAIGLQWQNGWRYFDPLNGPFSNAPYQEIATPLSLREYYHNDLLNQFGSGEPQVSIFKLMDEFGAVPYYGDRRFMAEAMLALRNNNPAEAKRLSEKALEKNPESEEAHALLATFYLSQKNCATASPHLRALLPFPRGQVFALSALYSCNTTAWPYDVSWLDLFQKGVANNPDNMELRAFYSQLLLLHRRYPQAVEETHRLIYQNPVNAGLWDNLILGLEMQGRWGEAQEIIDTMGGVAMQFPSYHFSQALRAWKSGNREKTVSELEELAQFVEGAMKEEGLPIYSFEISKQIFNQAYPQEIWRFPELRRAAAAVYFPLANKADITSDWRLLKSVTEEALRFSPNDCFLWKERHLAEKNLGLIQAAAQSCTQAKKVCGEETVCR